MKGEHTIILYLMRYLVRSTARIRLNVTSSCSFFLDCFAVEGPLAASRRVNRALCRPVFGGLLNRLAALRLFGSAITLRTAVQLFYSTSPILPGSVPPSFRFKNVSRSMSVS